MEPNFPISLRENNLQDSIIVFQYSTNYAVSYIESNLLHFLNQHNIREFEKLRKKDQKKLDTNSDVGYIVIKRYFYANKKFSFEVTDNEIMLNCTQAYIGWKEYSIFVYKVIEFLESIQAPIDTITMQYISAFLSTDILSAVDGEIKLKHYPRLEGTQFKFNIPIGDEEGRYNGIFATVVLTNNASIRQEERNQRISIVDIILQTKVGDISAKGVVEHVHQQEKNLFFSMMSKNFIDSLGAIYAK